MSTNPVPGLITPAPYADSASAGNWQALLLWSKTVSPRMFSVGTAITPTAPPAPPAPPSDAYLVQRGGQLVAFTAGTGTLTLPLPFPNGWLSLMLCGNGDFQYNPSGATLQAITVTASGSPTASVVVDYDALGW
jgi:hypothetical protein